MAFTSSNAVSRFLAVLGDAGRARRVRWAAVGTGTARALADGGFPSDLVPETSVSQALAEAFPLARSDGTDASAAARGPA